MQINVTFIIQIINFWITYAILHKLLLKPVVRLVNNKEAGKAMLLNGLKEKEAALVRLQEDKKKNIDIFRNHLKTHYVFKQAQVLEIPASSVFNKKAEEIEALIATTKALLVEKVPHAY
jgi:hypothetical protein